MPEILPHAARGPLGRPPIVFLHGFAGDREGWLGQQIALETRFRTIAFDLPGHGRALDWPVVGHAGVAAEAVAGSLAAMGIARFHLVGHSMGGAAATLLALRAVADERVASLTLLAPGGFGREIDADLIRRFAAATGESELTAVLDRFFGDGPRPSAAAIRHMVAARGDPRVPASLARIADLILDGDAQKPLDRGRLAACRHPVRLIWGELDQVQPVAHTLGVPGVVAVHRFAGVGHMPHLEIARDVTRLIAESAAGA
ncbi:alpha/beta fold hydrolase [Siculibacillus lacustris]|uniref:Alpha/beta fold hydrolase n=1 Tax=Siculibacillus lacustris TaxID=1549641 RepID=A0A4V2KU49_9HYPH|nr:alpha/beta fold hydrolase [Siculibacillus lacustris]TBW39974.1 alpha/beta fold hydrolase [Siculibacillus lacustris]